ncbi:unnamed protein product [Parnassius apollo]|uniref:(apollo) hypothetical protein n=1 Tax=Parnassius apollo TaxID=110799 RepID=A0A8S3XVH7_PARAO|nr:unnamed protein product [Parnassius apollo]
MAPPPEYDKEPKAPDKSVTNLSADDSKISYNLVKEQQSNSDHKSSNATANAEIENNKHTEKAKAVFSRSCWRRWNRTSRRAKRRRGVRGGAGGSGGAAGARGARRGGAHGRRALPHSNSLQDLMAAALAAEAPRQRAHAHPPPASVSARAHHGGSLPSGVDTSSMLSEEPTRGGYLATVRCVNPPPLAERRVSASDANGPPDPDTSRRSKPMFPITYTARATLEIGSSSVCSGRAVTTTTPSNQVRTTPSANARSNKRFHHNRNLHRHQIADLAESRGPVTCGPPDRLYTKARLYNPEIRSQARLMNALRPKAYSIDETVKLEAKTNTADVSDISRDLNESLSQHKEFFCANNTYETKQKQSVEKYMNSEMWIKNVQNWYKGLDNYFLPCNTMQDHYKNNKTVENLQDFQKMGTFVTNSVYNTYTNTLTLFPSKQNLQKFEIKPSTSATKKVKILTNKHENKSYHQRAKNNTKLEPNSEIWCDIESRNSYYNNKIEKNLIIPTLSSNNPRNFRCTTIGKIIKKSFDFTEKSEMNDISSTETDYKEKKLCMIQKKVLNNQKPEISFTATAHNKEMVDDRLKNISKNNEQPQNTTKEPGHGNVFVFNEITKACINSLQSNSDVEMVNFISNDAIGKSTFSQFVNDQQKLFQLLEDECIKSDPDKAIITENKIIEDIRKNQIPDFDYKSAEIVSTNTIKDNIESSKTISDIVCKVDTNQKIENAKLQSDSQQIQDCVAEEIYDLEPLHNTYIALTLPVSFLSSPTNTNIGNSTRLINVNNKDLIPKEKNDKLEKTSDLNSEQKLMKRSKDNKKARKSAFTVLLFKNLFQRADSLLSDVQVITPNYTKEVDSTIPFSCITTPEVVASCNTTSSTSQSAVAVDPKPLQQLQPGSCYRALTSLTGEPAPRLATAAAPAPAPHTPQTPAEAPTPTAELQQQSRSVVSSSFNGLPLTRPSYGSTTAATDDCKVPIFTVHYRLQKSLDENGNAVQGFSSPLSGSSQHKKPRRKKSSKNETVIKSQEIDGYQGNKDLNEVLRFIESNADSARGNKIGRAKHKDDSDDKASKKRSTDRRKDKENKMKRATSMEELSRTKLSDLTDKPVPRTEPVKAERRSWGEDAREPRDTFYLRDDTELTDFQTVTKKRKPKRRPDEPEPNRRTRAPEPRPRRESAPPSDRSNDSNDDMDSLHSLTSLPPAPTPAAPQPAHASYADIARTRHNIPDLIESCNFYAEGEPAADPNRRDPPPETQAPGDTDYPALDARTRRRDKTAPRQPRKERPEARAGACPAPDVVSDRRPAVMLLDCASRPRDMDGVTFGFDINEQLVGAARRPRCDLVRDALEGAVAVAAGGAALRYVPPPLAAHDARRAHQLNQLVHYVGAAWEDVVRCGNGKVRYFSE